MSCHGALLVLKSLEIKFIIVKVTGGVVDWKLLFISTEIETGEKFTDLLESMNFTSAVENDRVT